MSTTKCESCCCCFFTYFVSCNGPCALKEKWHRKEHIIIIIFISDAVSLMDSWALMSKWHTNHTQSHVSTWGYVTYICVVLHGKTLPWVCKLSGLVTRHAPNGHVHIQIGIIQAHQHFKSRMNKANAQSFPGAAGLPIFSLSRGYLHPFLDF